MFMLDVYYYCLRDCQLGQSLIEVTLTWLQVQAENRGFVRRE